MMYSLHMDTVVREVLVHHLNYNYKLNSYESHFLFHRLAGVVGVVGAVGRTIGKVHALLGLAVISLLH